MDRFTITAFQVIVVLFPIPRYDFPNGSIKARLRSVVDYIQTLPRVVVVARQLNI